MEPNELRSLAMTENTTRRRGHGEDAIYLDPAKNRYVGVDSLGFGAGWEAAPAQGHRPDQARGQGQAQDAARRAHRGLHTSATYSVRQAAVDWLEGGLPGRSERTRSIYREALTPLLERIGAKPLRELTARDVRKGLDALSGTLSTRYLQITRASLARAIRYAEAHDLVGRNVATLVDSPAGPGRAAEPVAYPQPVPCAAPGGSGLPAQCVRRAKPHGRRAHRRGQGIALGSRRSGRRSGRGAAGAAIGGRMAFGAARRRHQDCQVAADAGASAGRRACSQRTPQEAGGGPAGGGGPVAGSWPRLRLGHRDAPRRGECPARVPQDHRRGRFLFSGFALRDPAPHLRLPDANEQNCI